MSSRDPDAHSEVIILTRPARTANGTMLEMYGKLYSYDSRLQRLPPHLQDVAAELRPFIQQENAMVRQRHFAGHRHLPAPDEPHIRDGMMRRPKRTRRH
jgi:hypothetical protein